MKFILNKKNIVHLAIITCMFVLFVCPFFLFAQDNNADYTSDSVNGEVNYGKLADQGYGVGVLISSPGRNITGVIAIVVKLIEIIFSVIIGLAVLYFLFGLLKYVKSSDEKEQIESRGIIMNGIVILFVMVSIWGLVKVVSDTLQIDDNTRLQKVNINVDSLIK